ETHRSQVTRATTQMAAVNMRFLWMFLFLVCLLSTSHTQVEDASYKTPSANVPPDSSVVAIQDTVNSLDSSNATNKPSSSVLNQELLAQQGVLGSIILNNQKLLGEREKLLLFLQGDDSAFNDKNDFPEAAGPEALEDLLCKGSLGGLCGHGSLVGMNDVLKITNSGKVNSWVNIMHFNILKVSWKAADSSNLQLQLQTELNISLPGLLKFLSGSVVDVTIVVDLTIEEINPDQLSLVLKDCETIYTGINVRIGALPTMMDSMLKWSLNFSLPSVLCRVVRFWFYIINQHLAILKNIASTPLRMLGNDSSTSSDPLKLEDIYLSDFKNQTFPASFINWLIKKPSP
ncbi:hypothetical protein NP303_24945, partial [Salmonella enterica]|nr:hypothetical protein [Salmonella enterica]